MLVPADSVMRVTWLGELKSIHYVLQRFFGSNRRRVEKLTRTTLVPEVASTLWREIYSGLIDDGTVATGLSEVLDVLATPPIAAPLSVIEAEDQLSSVAANLRRWVDAAQAARNGDPHQLATAAEQAVELAWSLFNRSDAVMQHHIHQLRLEIATT